MATRLNKEMRATILANATEGAFEKELERNRIDLYKAAKAVWEHGLNPHIRKVKTMPERFNSDSRTDMCIRFKPAKNQKTVTIDVYRNFKYGCPKSLSWHDGNEWQYFDAADDIKDMIEDHDTRVKESWPVSPRYVMQLRDFNIPKPKVDALIEANNTYQETLKNKKDLKANVQALLQGSYSVEKLLENWPSAAQYLPALPVVGKSMVINVPALEAMLDASRK